MTNENIVKRLRDEADKATLRVDDTVAKLFAYARIGRDGVVELRKHRDEVIAKSLRTVADAFEKDGTTVVTKWP